MKGLLSKIISTSDFRTFDFHEMEGKPQGEKLGELLKNKDIKRIYSSDLPRAIETSKIIENTI